MLKVDTVELKKKDAHALGLLCYAEGELQERMADYLASLYADETTLGKIYAETAEQVSGVVFDNLADIINAIAFDMVDKAKGC